MSRRAGGQSASPSELSTDAAEVLAPEIGLLPGLDPISFGRALGQLAGGVARRPLSAVPVGVRWATDLGVAMAATGARALGAQVEGPVAPGRRDRRFADPTWEGNPLYYGLLQSYLIWAKALRSLTDVVELDEATRKKADLALELIIDALAPTNTLPGNPAALQKAFQTGGRSLLRGLRNFVDDLANNNGKPRQVDTSKLVVGRDLAATPGKVVFRSDLMELIQYAPQTDTVFEVPLLASPPWINKYYVMDLAPGRSFVEWAVKRGHTTFAISYRNPDASMRDVSLDDYLVGGPLAALDVIADITKSEQVNIVGLCLGGTLTTALLAYLAETGRDCVSSATLLNTLIDFRDPGQLGAFTDEESIRRLERKMAKHGYLESSEMAGTFDLMRSNDLIWNYVASNWLMGQDPPAFDILTWNADGTRMPAAMHSFYLRSCYLENQLARGEMVLAGTPLHLEAIKEDVYLLAAKEDHIAPWTAAYRASQHLKGGVRFVLSSSGHIAGIVNPPSPKSRHWTNPKLPPDPGAWLARATEHQGSWWEDWASWIKARGGERRKPPGIGSRSHRPLDDAPGTYVHGK